MKGGKGWGDPTDDYPPHKRTPQRRSFIRGGIIIKGGRLVKSSIAYGTRGRAGTGRPSLSGALVRPALCTDAICARVCGSLPAASLRPRPSAGTCGRALDQERRSQIHFVG